MNAKIKILKYLEITNNCCSSLQYISKLLNILDIFDFETVKNFYLTYKDRKKDIKINNKLSVSINYILTRNFEFLEKIDDSFFIHLLIDNEEYFELSDTLELRLIEIINKSSVLDIKLYKYITKYHNNLILTETSAKYIFDVSKLMSYTKNDIKVIRQILLKNRETKTKEEIIKYIKTQGCINNIILYNCFILQIYNVSYISNIDIATVKKIFCYSHFIEHINKSRILQRYFVSLRDLDCMLKYPEYAIIDDLIKYCNDKSEEKISSCLDGLQDTNVKNNLHNDQNKHTQVDFPIQEILVMYLINKKHTTICDIQQIINKLGLENKLLIEFFKIKGYDLQEIDPKRIKLNDHDNSENDKLKKSTSIVDRVNARVLSLQKIKDSYPIHNNIEISLLADAHDDILFDKNRFFMNIDMYLKRIHNKEFSSDEVCNLIDLIFEILDFKRTCNLVLDILKSYRASVIEKIQINLLKVLDDGFFEVEYFENIRNLYNKLLVLSNTSKTKKNNDTILIKLSKYCNFFDKEIHIGNIKK